MLRSPFIVHAGLALAITACHLPSVGPAGATDADEISRRAQAVLARYGVGGMEVHFLGPSPQRDEGAGIALEHALALALETFLGYREHPKSVAALAVSQPPCDRASPVAATACFMTRPGAAIAIAFAHDAPGSAVLSRELARRDAYAAFALTIPELDEPPFWVAVGSDGAGGAIATFIPNDAARPLDGLEAATTASRSAWHGPCNAKASWQRDRDAVEGDPCSAFPERQVDRPWRSPP